MGLITVVLLWFELPAKRHLPIGQLKNRARLSPGLSDTTFFVRYEGHVRKFRWFRLSNNNNKNCCSGSSSGEKQKKPQRSLILGCLCRQPFVIPNMQLQDLWSSHKVSSQRGWTSGWSAGAHISRPALATVFDFFSVVESSNSRPRL